MAITLQFPTFEELEEYIKTEHPGRKRLTSRDVAFAAELLVHRKTGRGVNTGVIQHAVVMWLIDNNFDERLGALVPQIK